MRGAVLKRPVAGPAGGEDIHGPSEAGGGSGGGRVWGARRPMKERDPGSRGDARREGLLSGAAGGEGEGGDAIGAGETFVAASARVVKHVHNWQTPSVARWLRVRRVRCPSRSEHRCR